MIEKRQREALRQLEGARDEYDFAKMLLGFWSTGLTIYLSVLAALIAFNIVLSPTGYDMGGWNVLGAIWGLILGFGLAYSGVEHIVPNYREKRKNLRLARYAYEDSLMEDN